MRLIPVAFTVLRRAGSCDGDLFVSQGEAGGPDPRVVTPSGDVYVPDSMNRVVHKFARRQP